jgi:hypothetical protein
VQSPVEARQCGDESKQKPEPRTYAFQWEKAPWPKVLKWLADTSGLPVITAYKPTGSVTFLPPMVNGKQKQFTLEEIIDILNEALVHQKLQLVRRQASIGFFPTDEPLDDSARTVRIEDLAVMSKSQIVRIVYPLKMLTAETFAPGVKKLMGPFGQVVPLEEPNQLVLIDTVANLRTIVATIREIEDRTMCGAQTWSHKCLWCKASVAAEKLKEVLTESPRARRAKVVRVTITADDRTNTVFVSGPPDKIALARSVVEKLDVRGPGDQPGPKTAPSVLKTYRVPTGSADGVAKMLLEIYKSSPQVRLTAVGGSAIMVYASGEDHEDIMQLLRGCSAQGRR